MQKDANLVELEKCCPTHVFLQTFGLIQPRTSPPKICKIFEKCIFEKCISSPTAVGCIRQLRLWKSKRLCTYSSWNTPRSQFLTFFSHKHFQTCHFRVVDFDAYVCLAVLKLCVFEIFKLLEPRHGEMNAREEDICLRMGLGERSSRWSIALNTKVYLFSLP